MLNFGKEGFTAQDVEQIFVQDKYPDFFGDIDIQGCWVQIKDKKGKIISHHILAKYLKPEYALEYIQEFRYPRGTYIVQYTKSFREIFETGESGVIGGGDNTLEYDYFFIYHVSELLYFIFTDLDVYSKENQHITFHTDLRSLKDNTITLKKYINYISGNRHDKEYDLKIFYFANTQAALEVWRKSFEQCKYVDNFPYPSASGEVCEVITNQQVNKRYTVAWKLQHETKPKEDYRQDKHKLIADDFILLFHDEIEASQYLAQI